MMSFGPNQVNCWLPQGYDQFIQPDGLTDFSLNRPNCLAVWASADISTRREGRLHVNLLNEGYSFLLRSATDLLSDC